MGILDFILGQQQLEAQKKRDEFNQRFNQRGQRLDAENVYSAIAARRSQTALEQNTARRTARIDRLNARLGLERSPVEIRRIAAEAADLEERARGNRFENDATEKLLKQEVADQVADDQRKARKIAAHKAAAFDIAPKIDQLVSEKEQAYGIRLPSIVRSNAASYAAGFLAQGSDKGEVFSHVSELLDSELLRALPQPSPVGVSGEQPFSYVGPPLTTTLPSTAVESAADDGVSVGGRLTALGAGSSALGLATSAVAKALAPYGPPLAEDASMLYGLSSLTGFLESAGIAGVGVGLPLSLLPFLPKASVEESLRQRARYGEVRYGPSGGVLEK